MVQDRSKAAHLARAGAKLVGGDCDRPEMLAAALDGVDRSLLLYAVDERLVERETRFVEQAKQNGLGHLVKFSRLRSKWRHSYSYSRLCSWRMLTHQSVGFEFSR